MKQAPSFSDRRSQHRERFAGAVLAILVQAGFVALLVVSRPMMAPPEKGNKELTLFLPRLMPAPASKPSSARSAPFFAPAPIVPLPPTANAPLAAPLPQMRAVPAAPDLRSFGQSMFGCAPEMWSTLTPEQKAKCPRPGEGYAVREAPNLMGAPSRTKDEAHWAYEWQKKESPLLLPGASPDKFGIAIFSSNGPSLLGGCDGPCTLYDIDKPAAEDFYKQEQSDAAWRAAHKGAPGSPESVGIHPQ